jgi:hypothetical protein
MNRKLEPSLWLYKVTHACRVQISEEDVKNIAELGLASNDKYVSGVETRPASNSKLLLHVLVTPMLLSFVPRCSIAWDEGAVYHAFGEKIFASFVRATNSRCV